MPKKRGIMSKLLKKEDERLVKRIAYRLFKKYCPAGENGPFSLEDLYQFGFIGLFESKKKFDEKKGVPFQAYAAIRIRGAIMDAIRKSPLIRLPQEHLTRAKELAVAKSAMQKQGITPTPENLSSELNWAVDDILKFDALENVVTSFDNDENTTIQLADSNHQVEKTMLQKDLARAIETALSKIPEDLWLLTFIARNLNNMKLKQIADQFGCSIEKVRQMDISAKESMKRSLEMQGWDLE